MQQTLVKSSGLLLAYMSIDLGVNYKCVVPLTFQASLKL
jgi:hypothetical protein